MHTLNLIILITCHCFKKKISQFPNAIGYMIKQHIFFFIINHATFKYFRDFFLSETEKIREDINFQIRNCKHELTGEMF